MSRIMNSRLTTVFSYGLNKGLSSKFPEPYRIRQALEKDWRMQQAKRYMYNILHNTAKHLRNINFKLKSLAQSQICGTPTRV